jgi:hypothetical protein
VGDVLWICRKDFKAAQIAVASFLEAADFHKTADLWPPHVERLDRAAIISARRGFEEERDLVIQTVSGEWNFAGAHWATAESWHRRNNDDAATQRSMIEAAECLVARAQAAASDIPPQNGSASHWMGRAVEALRRAKAEPKRIKVVHRRLLEFQKASLNELKPFDFDPDSIPGLKENREKVQRAATIDIRGFDFEKAVLRFAHIGHPTNVVELIESEKANSEGTIWDKVVGANQLDRDGKIADVMPALGVGDENTDQLAFREKLVQSASLTHWPVAVEWGIEPARRAISYEHPIRTRDLAFLVTNNPFIRAAHEGIYLQGIQAEFIGDWLLAMHLLIPQLEESARYVLQQHGVVTSNLKQGVQMEKDINELLWDRTAEEIFGEDYLFDLRGIMIERLGCNMRNEMAHGLMCEAALYRAEAVYLWWLVIRLCWVGLQAGPPEEHIDES